MKRGDCELDKASLQLAIKPGQIRNAGVFVIEHGRCTGLGIETVAGGAAPMRCRLAPRLI